MGPATPDVLARQWLNSLFTNKPTYGLMGGGGNTGGDLSSGHHLLPQEESESLAGDYTDTSTMDPSGQYSYPPDVPGIPEDVTPATADLDGLDPYWLNGGWDDYGALDDPYWSQGEWDDYGARDSLPSGSGSVGGMLGGMGGIGSAPIVGGPGGAPGGGNGGGNTNVPPSGMTWWNQQYRRTPTMQNTLDNWLLGSYLTGPSALADQVTQEFDSQMNMNADRSHQRGMLNDILGAISGLGNGTGTRMQGFQDTRTGQGAALPGAQLANMGSTSNSITAGALPQANIQSAANTARGGGDYQAPNAGLPIPAAAQNELNQRYTTSMNNQGKLNETNLNRYANAANAQLGRASQVAAADQGVDNAAWLIGQNAANAQNDMMHRNAILRHGIRQLGVV